MVYLFPLDKHQNESIDQGPDIAQSLIGEKTVELLGKQPAVAI